MFLIANARAQQPSHFVIGKEELAGIDIYDLHQDHKNNYWIATNNGIYKYDCYSIKKVNCSKMKNSSVFNFVEDYNNNIYCNNLGGQIFQIKNDSCKLYFTMPDTLLGLVNTDIKFDFDNNGKLIIAAKALIQVSEEKKITVLKNEIFYMHRDKDSSLVLVSLKNKKLYNLKDGTLSIISISDTLDPFLTLNSVQHQNNIIVYDILTGNVVPQVSSNFGLDLPNFKHHNRHTRYYSDNQNFWASNVMGGVYLIDEKKEVKNNYEPFFKDEIISSFLKDKEGNIIFGTFGSGLIIIPNLNILDVVIAHATNKITKITSSDSGSIFLGTRNGEIFEVDQKNKVTTLQKNGIQQIELLEFLTHSNALFYNSNIANYIDLETNQKYHYFAGSIKDIHEINDHLFIVASNRSVLLYDIIDYPDRIDISNVFTGRTNCVGYDDKTKSIYSGSIAGLRIGRDKDAPNIKINNKSVLCRKILNIDDKILVTTKNNGVLVFKNDSLIDNWTTKKGLLSNNCNIIKEYQEKLYLSTQLGINILDKTGNVLSTISKSNGLNSNSIDDFDIVNGYLWTVTNKGLQKFKLDKIHNTDYFPSIKISNILLNDKKLDTSLHEFNYTQKRFVFTLESKTLKYKSDIHYKYKLEGIDNEWITQSYGNHIIEYKSLPPNKYTFKVKAEYKLNESETITYSFVIKKPYWNRWWFYTIIIGIIIMLTFLFFNLQSKRERKKTLLENQLNLSQLTALKSQMNPHFIFNSLNSIQDLILKQDRENAYNYISKFALLVRKILHHSDKDFIDIEEEIEILTIYLELEELRFKKDFSFQIESSNINGLEIPPMLIQPFVENAIKHGLLHKKGEKFLAIVFKFQDNIMLCEITDNGIGREKSQEIKVRQNKTHESFSLKSIISRFDILKSLYGDNLGVTIKDNREADSGTKVILKIPYKRQY